MSAAEKSHLEIAKLAIIAGSGSLPMRLIAACDNKGITPFIVGFEGQTDPAVIQGREYMWTRLGCAGSVMKTLKSHDIHDIVMIGSIRRPSFSELVPDFKTIEFFTKIGIKALGDNGFLTALRKFLEAEGFTLHGIHKFAENLLAAEGPIGAYEPGKDDWVDIDHGLEISRQLGAFDIGQSVIVQEGFVLGVEAVEGTDELIRRCKALKRKGRGGVLVKTCKPQQDRDLDLPTIGPQTIKLAAETGLAGIAVYAGETLVIDPEEVAEIADKHKMFVVGLKPSRN
jgi:UDP-2,3-diacylglucosamine hydrolase